MQAHTLTFHQEKPFCCLEQACSKRFRTRRAAKEHLLTHRNALVFLCPFEGCGKRFVSVKARKQHWLTHTTHRATSCPYQNCPKRFTVESSLKRHLLQLHSESAPKLWPCLFDGCGKQFTTPGNRTRHLRSHSGEKPFVCPYENCGRRLSLKDSLQAHIRSHTGERPWSCPATGCDKRFIRRGALNVHKKIHAENKRSLHPGAGLAGALALTAKQPAPVPKLAQMRLWFCTIEGCRSRYKRKQGLKAHLLSHRRAQFQQFLETGYSPARTHSRDRQETGSPSRPACATPDTVPVSGEQLSCPWPEEPFVAPLLAPLESSLHWPGSQLTLADFFHCDPLVSIDEPLSWLWSPSMTGDAQVLEELTPQPDTASVPPDSNINRYSPRT
ncbi:MAG: C2H2-type zinc finger protein [Kistimonas sp.]|nr:C2H2-type zinc finger protein [Kistimonas sp.]